MKKKCAIATAAGLLVMVLPSCNSILNTEQTPSEMETKGQGTISVEMKRMEASVKSGTSFTAAKDYETVFNKTQVLVYDKATGRLEKCVFKSDSTSTFELTVPTGEKSVWAFVNYSTLENAYTEDELKAWTLDLTENTPLLNEGFILGGSTTATVTAGQTVNCTVKVSRYAARVALASITNSIPAGYSVALKWACLTNVAGSCSFGEIDTVSTWFNAMGRFCDYPPVKSHIIDGATYKAMPENLTFAKITVSGKYKKGTTHTPEEPYLFYSLPNKKQVEPNGFTSNYYGSKTTLVVAATLNDELMYYPIVLDSLKRNTAYTVNLNLLGPGSSDPNVPVEKSSVGVSIQTEPWIDGGVIDYEI